MKCNRKSVDKWNAIKHVQYVNFNVQTEACAGTYHAHFQVPRMVGNEIARRIHSKRDEIKKIKKIILHLWRVSAVPSST